MANSTTNLLHCLLLLFCLLTGPSTSTAILRRSTKSDPSEVNKEFLEGHNTLRASLNLPLLRWSLEMVYRAKWWAEQRRADCALKHSYPYLYGENIFWGQGRHWNASDAVAAWAAEGADYTYRTNECAPNKVCGHYTQMVWNTTAFLGCAKIKCLNGDTFVVCEYSPPGNIIGDWPY